MTTLITPIKALLIMIAALCLCGCKIALSVPEFGHVATESGIVYCENDATCLVAVRDTSFKETFTAYPDPGYQFIGWLRQSRGLCGGAMEPCLLDASVMAENDALLQLLNSDEVFYLQPGFIPVDHIRAHQVGDRAQFEGTLETLQRGGEPVTTPVQVRDEYTGLLFNELDVTALTRTRYTTLENTGATQVATIGFWQDASGTFHDLKDNDGNAYLTSSSGDYGVISIPSPAVPIGSTVVDYYIMFGGHTSGPIVEGTRSIERFDLQPELNEEFRYPVYKVVINDSYAYLVTYDEHKRSSSVVVDLELWISPAKGVVRSQETLREYSGEGLLEKEQILALNLVKTNY